MSGYNNLELGKRIRDKREEIGMTMEQLGKHLGVNKSTVKRYEDGETKSIKLAVLEKIAAIFGTTTSYLYYGNTDKPPLATHTKKLSKIPVLGLIRAGAPIIANEEILGYTFIDENDPENYFALKVTGDSMNAARIYEGDVVICRKQSYVENGQIAVVLIDNEDATVKRFYADNDTVRLEPQSTNPENHAIILNPKENRFEILGRVVKVEFNVQ